MSLGISSRLWALASATSIALSAAPLTYAEPDDTTPSSQSERPAETPAAQAEPSPDAPAEPTESGEPNSPPPPTPGAVQLEPGAPGAPPAPAPGETTITAADLGRAESISFNFSRNVTSSTINIPVPAGLTPVSMSARLEVPIPLKSGTITVSQSNRTIFSADLPPNGTQLVIPLNGAEIWGNWLNLTVTLTAVGPDNFCWDYRSPIRLSTGSVAFTGAPAAPTTVATFLPPALKKMTVVIPQQPSRAESEAAVQLAGILQRRYSGKNLELSVVPVSDTTPPPPGAVLMERRIILTEGQDKGLSLQAGQAVPTLLISGTGDDLLNQVRFLGDASLASAVSTKAVAGPLAYEQKFAYDKITLERLLGRPQLSSEGLWPAVGITLDQTKYGHALRGVSLHLIGSHTPLPNDLGGEVVVSINGQVIDRWAVDPTGTIDRTVAIKDQLLDRSTNVDVRVRTNGDMGHCGDYPPMILRINGETEVRSSEAELPITPGFRSLPQTFLPSVLVGIGADTFGDTVRATQIVMALQRTSGVPLATEVTDLDEAINSKQPAILISPQGWSQETVALPVKADKEKVTLDVVDPDGNESTVALDSSLPVGSLQIVSDGNRAMLIATSNGAPGQLDELLRWLSADRSRWSSLDGRAIISVPGIEPLVVPTPEVDLTPRKENFYSLSQWWVWGIIAVVAAASAGALLILLRARRKSD